MKIDNPFRPRAAVQFTSDEERQLAQLQQQFIEKLKALPESQQRAIVRTTAAGMKMERRRSDGGADVFVPDAFTRSLATQLQKVFDANDRIRAAQDEIAEIDGMHREKRRELLGRREELEEAVKLEMVRVIEARDMDHSRARENAVLEFRSAAEETAKAAAVIAATDRIRQEAGAQDAENRARAIVNAERRAAGQKPLAEQD